MLRRKKHAGIGDFSMNESLIRRAVTLIEKRGPIGEAELWKMLDSKDGRIAFFYDLRQWSLTHGRISWSAVTKKWKRVERVAGLRQPPEFRPLRHDMHAHERLAMAAR